MCKDGTHVRSRRSISRLKGSAHLCQEVVGKVGEGICAHAAIAVSRVTAVAAAPRQRSVVLQQQLQACVWRNPKP